MDILEQMIARAKANPQRIVLPEGDEPRTLEAANILLRDKIAHIILIGDPKKIGQMAAEKGYEFIQEAKIVDPLNDPKMPEYANLLFELRKAKGMTEEEAKKKAQDPLYLGCLMIKAGDADGELAGARGTTADTIRPAFQILKTRPGCSIVSGAFLMFTPAKQLGENGFLLFADCAVNPNPDAKQLAEIAVSTAETARAIAGIEPLEPGFAKVRVDPYLPESMDRFSCTYETPRGAIRVSAERTTRGVDKSITVPESVELVR